MALNPINRLQPGKVFTNFNNKLQREHPDQFARNDICNTDSGGKDARGEGDVQGYAEEKR